MQVEKIDVSALVNKTKALLKNEKISFPTNLLGTSLGASVGAISSTQILAP